MSEASVTLAPGLWVHCEAHGPEGAPAIVLLPPFGGSGELFDPFRIDLARDQRVITCEPPGTGDSAPPKGAPSTRALARDVIEALDRVGAGRAHLFGISLGGMIAQWIAIDAPARVDRLVLASTASRGLSAVESVTMQKLALARCLLREDPNLCLAEEVMSDEALDRPGERERVEAAVHAHPRSRGELLWLASAAALHDTTSELHRISAPTLVLTGDADTLIPADAQRALAAAIAGAEHQLIANAAHDLTLDQAARTAEAVRAFVART